MNYYSKSSEERLATCHPDLQLLLRTVLPHFDHVILCGHRGQEDQNKAYNMGNSQLVWPKSRHNKFPSIAVDVAPYPLDWNNHKRMYYFAGFVKGIALELLKSKKISHEIRYGGDWDQDTYLKDNKFNDLVHFELASL